MERMEVEHDFKKLKNKTWIRGKPQTDGLFLYKKY